jgi:hypothetical protein
VKKFIFILIVVSFIVYPMLSIGVGMGSSNYKIQQDSVNFGGDWSSSASFQMEDTVGEVATGDSSSSSYVLHAGYQQMNDVYISISSPADITMSPEINGLSGGTGSGSVVWTVVTDSFSGYSLGIRASTSPALKGSTNGGEFADYTPTGSDPDFTWSVPSTNAEFGFSPEGTDTVQKYKDNGLVCNAGTGETTNKCWDGLQTTDKLVSMRTSSNHPLGSSTTVKFQAEVGNSKNLVNDTYNAQVTVTAVSL